MSTQNAELRRKIIEDVLGDSYEEYENFSKDEALKNESKRQHRQRIPLWRFLLHLLNRDKNGEYIEWNKEKPLEFRIRNTTGVAELWGSVKNKSDMTYEKLGRAMRYYYGKNVIEKVSGRRYSYRFILSRRTRKHLAHYTDISSLKEDKNIIETDHEGDNDTGVSSGDENVPDTPPKSPQPSESDKQTTTTNDSETERVESVRLLEHHTIGKTKIFRPDELMFRSLNQFSKSNEKRLSAFSVPEKRRHPIQYFTMVEEPLFYPKYASKLVLTGQKRHFSENIYTENSEVKYGERSDNSPDNKIRFHQYRRVYSTPQSSDEFILRRETCQEELDRHEKSVLRFHRHLSLNYKLESERETLSKYDDEKLQETRKHLVAE